MVDHFEPNQRTRFVGQLLSWLGLDFRGADIEACIEAFEREAFESIRAADRRQHLFLNATRLNTWPEFPPH
eukprot:4109375-Amphidinium_carterae.1